MDSSDDKPYLTDRDLLGDKAGISHDEVQHVSRLTEEELVIEKKLRRRIDSLIMPLVILVYLMNYIDRFASSPNHHCHDLVGLMLIAAAITMPLPDCKVWKLTFTCTGPSTRRGCPSYSSATFSCRYPRICY